MAKTKILLSERKRKICEMDAKTVAFYRRNPNIACEDLLGVKLIDVQRYILQSVWNASHSALCCSRNFGKSFLGAIIMLLKALLYENQAIYIVSSVGDQAKETFNKIEEIVLNTGKTSDSIASLKTIAKSEIVITPPSKTGFSHSSSGYHVKFYNGSEIYTLNSRPDNVRSRRATLVFFDEAAFCSDELITICEAFATQNTEFTTSVDDDYNPFTSKRKCPTQLIYASSQGEITTIFYKHYRDFAKRMIAGDRNYFACDMDCETAMTVYLDGQKWTPLLTKDKVEAALKVDREKSLREYFNQPVLDGGVNQVVKQGTITRNEDFILPVLSRRKKHKYVLSFDPARSKDNSIVLIMEICRDKDIGYYGRIVNCVNMVDFASSRHYKLDSNRQIDAIHELLLNYNGKAPDYENIYKLQIDAGAGGGGVSAYGDGLLKPWIDDNGISHKGLIDLNYKLYEGYSDLYPDNANQLTLIDPRAEKRNMVEEMIELLSLDLIKFPRDYAGKGFVRVYEEDKDGEESFTDISLSSEQEEALYNINALKTEITSIHRFENSSSGTVRYELPKDKENKMHDDRFYAFIMCCHFLYNLRRQKDLNEATDRCSYTFVPLCN